MVSLAVTWGKSVKQFRNWLQKHRRPATFLLAGLTIALAIYVLQTFDLSAIGLLRPTTWLILLGAFLISTITYLGAVWFLLRDMGQTTPLLPLYMVLHASLATNYTSPVKIGVPLRVYLYKQILQVPYAQGTASVTILNVIWLLLLGILALQGIPGLSNGPEPLSVVLLLTSFGLALCAIVFFPWHRFENLVSRFPLASLSRRLLAFVTNTQQAIRQTTGITLLVVVVIILGRLYLTAYTSHLILRDFGYDIGAWQILTAQAISLLVGLISMIPMGIGTRDVSMVLLLSQAGVPTDVLVSLTLIERLIWSVLPFLIGLVGANYLGLRILSAPQDPEVNTPQPKPEPPGDAS